MSGTLYTCHGTFIWNIETQFASHSVKGVWWGRPTWSIEPQFATCSVKESWGLVVGRRNVGFWCEMGVNINVLDFERALMLALDILCQGEDVLVHCKQGKHRTGAFLCFLLCLLDGEELHQVAERYCANDSYLHPRDRRRVFQASLSCRTPPLKIPKSSSCNHTGRSTPTPNT